MTQPAPDSQIHKLKTTLRLLSWVLFGVIMFAIGVDMVLAKQGALARATSLGACLGFVMHAVFGLLSHRRRRPKANQMLGDMWLGLLGKWTVAIVGFVVIFGYIKVGLPMFVFVGFIIMQLAITVSLYRLGINKQNVV